MAQRGWFYRVRVALLSCVLAAVSLWGCQDMRARRARNEWSTPLRVGIVILRRGNVDPRALEALRARTTALEAQLESEFRRYRGAQYPTAIRVLPYGPVEVSDAPPGEPGVSLVERAVHAYRLWRYTQRVDSAAGVPTHELDSRIYVLAEAPRSAQLSYVEGFSEARGRVGVARVDLDLESVDLALFVATHELLHTLGASDKYDDETGRTKIPLGLPDPDLVPLYPQRHAEVMARNRVLSSTLEVTPVNLEELRVGRATAEEIGWLR